MAEFAEVMKQRKRMCKTIKACAFCPLGFGNNGTNDDCVEIGLNKPEEAEKIIMEWAAAHPEPVYPSWNEAWKQLFPDAARQSESPCLKYFLSADRINCRGIPCRDCTAKPIPADIAEKLGIKPISEEAV